MPYRFWVSGAHSSTPTGHTHRCRHKPDYATCESPHSAWALYRLASHNHPGQLLALAVPAPAPSGHALLLELHHNGESNRKHTPAVRGPECPDPAPSRRPSLACSPLAKESAASLSEPCSNAPRITASAG